MSQRLQMVIMLLSVVSMIYLIHMVKKDKVSLKYSLSWLIVMLLVFLLSIFPEGVKFFANLIGVKEPINALFFCGFIFILLILYSSTVSQSRNSEKIKLLVQESALQEYEIRRE